MPLTGGAEPQEPNPLVARIGATAADREGPSCSSCAEPSRARAVPAPGRASSAAREEAARSIGGARAGMAAPGALEPAAGSVPGTKVELTVSCR